MKSEPVGDVALGLNEGSEQGSSAGLPTAADNLIQASADRMGRILQNKAADGLENMQLWKSVEKTDPQYVSLIDGTKLSKINATYQKMRATELWGPYGRVWGLRDIVVGQTPETGLPVEIWAKAKFFCPQSEYEIIDDIGWRRGDDCRKKLMTRLLKKALSYLGFSALIYMGETDDDGASPEATEDHEKIFATLSNAARMAKDERQLQSVQDQCTEKKLGRFHRSSLATICAQRAAFLGIEMQAL